MSIHSDDHRSTRRFQHVIENRLHLRAWAISASADTACRADEGAVPTRVSSVRTAWLIAGGVTPRSAVARRKLRRRATLGNASTPSSTPCLTVKFCFMACQHYRE
jgi:hypothetical protein